MSRPKRKTIKLGPQALSELVKPARLEVYEGLQVAGPSSIADLARRLGRPADSLYYHVKKLLAIGVVEERVPPDREPSRRGRNGAVYAVTGLVDVQLNPESHESREAWAEGGAAVLRLAQRDWSRALDSGAVCAEGARRNLTIRRTKVRVSSAQLRELNERIDALHELLTQYAESTEGELLEITCVLTPLEERVER